MRAPNFDVRLFSYKPLYAGMTGNELNAWRKRRGLTQREAARRLGLSLKGLQNYLYGSRPVGAQTQLLVELTDQLAEQLSPGQQSDP